MKIIPFDIKLRKDIQSEENKYQGRYKVQTKSGNTVRIVCWDKKDFTFPIVALVEDSPGSAETTLSFRQDGMYYPRGIESNNDLCLLDTLEPKFKVGDRVRYKNSNRVYRIADILECHYLAIQPDQSSRLISFEDDDHLELAPEGLELTDFELEVKDIVTSALTETSEDGSWSCGIAIDDETARKITAGITKLINKKLYGCF